MLCQTPGLRSYPSGSEANSVGLPVLWRLHDEHLFHACVTGPFFSIRWPGNPSGIPLFAGFQQGIFLLLPRSQRHFQGLYTLGQLLISRSCSHPQVLQLRILPAVFFQSRLGPKVMFLHTIFQDTEQSADFQPIHRRGRRYRKNMFLIQWSCMNARTGFLQAGQYGFTPV